MKNNFLALFFAKNNSIRCAKIGLKVLLGVAAISFASCRREPPVIDVPGSGDLTSIEYAPTPDTIKAPPLFPKMVIPVGNPMTKQGVALGRRLFYDPILSSDSSLSCSSCHKMAGGFTDNQALSRGVLGLAGKRSAMSLENVGFYTKGLFWDGRVSTLEQQAEMPITDHLEMNESWDRAIEKLRRHSDYPKYFREAFGIKNKSEISKELAVKALSQFERTIVSSGKAKYDRAPLPFGQGAYQYSDDEIAGKGLFFNEDGFRDAQCGHCHNAPLFTTNEFLNNGLDSVADLDNFLDKGLGGFSGKKLDNGKFRVTSLRNIEFSAPYMHDGRMQTLEQVMEHYHSGGKGSDNISPLVKSIPLAKLTPTEIQQIIAFMKTLSDTTLLNNPALKSPF